MSVEKSFTLTGDAAKRSEGLVKCADNLASAQSKAVTKFGAGNCASETTAAFNTFLSQCMDGATAASAIGGSLPNYVGDLAACNASLGTCNGNVTACTGNLATCNGTVATCTGSLASCNGNVTACTGNLATCNGTVTTCTGNLATCNGTVATCTGNLATCNGTVTTCTNNLTTCTGDLTTCAADLAACESGPAGPTLKTGQSTCWTTAGAVVPCFGTGHDGELQRGAARGYLDNGDGTITDATTGLMWEKLSDDGSIHDKDTSYTWANAVASKVATLNAGSFAGHNDWRLPNRFELESITMLEGANPAVSSMFNASCGANSSGNPGCTVTTCSCASPNLYWSSSNVIGAAAFAQVVNFSDAVVSAFNKTFPANVRAVRGSSLLSGAYLDNGDGTISDTTTGLMWEKLSDDGTIHDKDNGYTWNNAFVSKVGALNAGAFAGHLDWRVPNRFELESIVSLVNAEPAAPAAFSANCGANSSGNPGCTVTTCSCTVPSRYWSSSTHAGIPVNAWTVNFHEGPAVSFDKTDTRFLRAVRGGS